MAMRIERTTALLAAVLLLALGAVRVEGHALLRASTPPPNGTLPAGASVLALRFSESVDFDRTRVVILAEDDVEIAANTVRVPGEPQAVRFETEPLSPGLYTVRWQTLSVDGDITQGSFQFTAGAALQTPAGPVAAWEPPADEPRSRVTVGLLRTLMVGAIVMVTGAAFFWLEIQRLRKLPRRYANVLVLLAALGVAGAGACLANLATRLQTSVPGVLETTAGRLLAVMAVLTLLQMLLAVVIRAREERPVRGWMAVLTGIGVLALLANTVAGHAIAGDDLDTAFGDLVLLATAAHIAVVTLWVGGVVALVTAAANLSANQLGRLLLRFSPWALAGVLVLAGTGLIMSVNALDRLSELWDADYGRLIALKTIAFVLLLGFGAWHRYRAAPRALTEAGPAEGAQRSLSAELSLMVAALAMAGVLAVSPQPAQPVERVAGPPVGQVVELDFGDYRGRLLLPDPLAARDEHSLWLELHSRTFADLANSAARLELHAPRSSAFGARALLMERVDAGRWTFHGPVFPVPGAWQLVLRVEGPRGAADTVISASVAPR